MYTYRMRKDKKEAFELRKQGKSYRAITETLGISKSTLSDWFKDVEWSKHKKIANIGRTTSKEHLEQMHKARKLSLDNLYAKTRSEAKDKYLLFKGEPLFWAGLMAYAGEGDKRSRSLVRISNSEFFIHTIFIHFAETYLGVDKGNIKCGLLLYPDHNESLCREMWSNILGIKRENFHKTQVIQGKERVKRLQYGVGMSIISSTVLKQVMLVWLSLAQDERF